METPTTALKKGRKQNEGELPNLLIHKLFSVKNIKMYLQNTIALMIVLAFILNISYIIYRSCNGIDTDQISLTALTSLSTLCGIVINYYFGSSESSRTKDETIKELKNTPSGDNPCN